MFPGDLAVWIPGFQVHSCYPSSIPGQGTEIPQAAQCGKKKNQKTKNKTKKTTYQIIKYKLTTTATAKLLQSCLTLHDPMDCSPPGSYVHGIVQARILKWTAMKKSSHVEGYL